MADIHYQEAVDSLTDYVRVRLLGAENAEGLTSRTPLVELGILNSVATARIVAHIREEFGVHLPPTALTGANFKDVHSMAELVVAQQGSDRAPRNGRAGEDGRSRV